MRAIHALPAEAMACRNSGMSVELACTSGPARGTKIPIIAGSPRIFKVLRQGVEAGSVVVELVDGQCVITNRSPKPVRVNGADRIRSVLRHDDRIEIGKDQFVLQFELEDEGANTQLMPGAEHYAPLPMHRTCTLCSGVYEGGAGWTDGDRRLCGSCIANGMTPKHLVDQSGAQGLVKRTNQNARIPSSGEIQVEVVEPITVLPPEPIPQPERQRRAISASMHSLVDDQGSLLKKVQSVFNGRADKQQLETLQKERQDLLAEAGRQALTGGFLGFSEQIMSDLHAGRNPTILAKDVARAPLDRWRAARDRLALLDAEITALRKALGMGFDHQPMIASAPTPRVVDRQREARAFAALDALNTEDLGASEGNEEHARTETVPMAPQSARKPAVPATKAAESAPDASQRRRMRRHTR